MTKSEINLNFMGLSAMYVADVQNPDRADQPVNWVLVGDFLVDSVTFGRDDASQFDVMVEEKDDAIFTEYTQQPLKLAGNMPNLNNDGKVLLGGYSRVVLPSGKVDIKSPAQTPTVTKMVKLVPKSGKYDEIYVYMAAMNLNIGDNLSKTATLNDKLTLTTVAPTTDMTWADGSAFAFRIDASDNTDILSFETVLAEVTNVVDPVTHTVAIGVPIGSDISGIIPFIQLSQGATVSPSSLVEQAFVTATPVTYTVTAENGTETQAWDVTITVAT